MKEDILQSWNDTASRKSIVDLVGSVTTEGSADFVPIEDRVATFDNDGTLWCEQPLQVQVFFILDKIKDLLSKNPELAQEQPYKAFAEKDMKTLMTLEKKQIFDAVFKATGEGTPEEYASTVLQWFKSSVHPKLGTSYYDVAYKPQLELLHYLRENGFKTFIVSGGGSEFMRVVSDRLYGIPTHKVIGTTGNSVLKMNGVKPIIEHESGLRNFDDRDEKVLNIHYHIGKRPILSFGNSDGDLAMLRYAITGSRKGLALLLHHDDAEREFAYDKDFKLSPLSEALDVAAAEGIHVVSMKNDWTLVF